MINNIKERLRKERRVLCLLFFIVLIGVIARTPGIFWGYHVFGNENIGFNPDEAPMVTSAKSFLSLLEKDFKKPIYEDYVNGIPFQISLLAFPLTFFMDVTLPVLAGIARIISLVYGIGLIILIFFISLRMFKDKMVGIFSSLFIALAGLHVSFSHIGKPDSANVFWIYFVLLFSYAYLKEKKIIHIILASVGTGFAAGTKFSVIQVIPLIYIIFKSDKRKIITNILLMIFVAMGSFALINGFSYTPNNFLDTIKTFSKDIYIREYNSLLNIPIHILNLFAGVGLPVFLLSLYGFILMLNRKVINKDLFFIFIFPMILYFVQFYNALQAPPRYILPLVPLLVIIAAYGFHNLCLKLNRKIFTTVLVLIIIYQSAYIFSSEINYIHDLRGLMGEWMLKNIDLNSKIYIGDAGNKYLSGEYFIITNKSKISNNRAVNRQGIVIPSEFRTVDDFNDADYIVIMNNRKYLRSSLNPLRDPLCCREVFYCHDYNECVFTQNLFRGKLQFKLIKKIESNALTPELWLYKKLLGTTYSNGIEDIFLFKKSSDIIFQIEK